MKTSNSKLFFLIALPVCLVTRTLQILYTVDAKTGFFIESMKLPAYMLLGLMLLAAVCIVISGILVKPKVETKNKFGGVISVLIGLAVLYEAANYNITRFTLTPYYVALLIFSVFGGVFFVLYGISALAKFNVHYIFYAGGVLLWTVKLIVIFTSYATVTTVCEHVIELMSLCAATLFLYFFARVRCGVPGKRSEKMYFVFGSLSSLLCFINGVGAVFAFIERNTGAVHSCATFGISSILFGIFAAAEILSVKQ